MRTASQSIFVILMITHLFFFQAHSQDYAFKVLVNKGQNEVRVGATWQPVKVGLSLNPSDEVKIAENSYLGLMHISGKPVEIKQSGNYKVTELANKVKGGSGVLNKYTDFILSENVERKNKLAATGAVHRGVDEIEVYLPRPEFSVVYGRIVTINWNTSKVKGPYVVSLNTMFGEELESIKTNDSLVNVDLYSKKFQNEDNILVKVTSQGSPDTEESSSLVLKKVSKADRERISTMLNEVSGSLNDETAINKLVLAGFFEKNRLLVDAITNYVEAIRLAPDVTYFKEAYLDFLLRNEIREAR